MKNIMRSINSSKTLVNISSIEHISWTLVTFKTWRNILSEPTANAEVLEGVKAGMDLMHMHVWGTKK